MTCPYCDNPLPPGVAKCPSCGAAVQVQPQQQPQQQYQQQYQQQPQQQYQQQPQQQKSPFVAELLSCCITGLGQMYNGQVVKGLTLLIANIVIAACTAGVGAFVLWLVSLIDAGCIAKKINNGRVVGPWEFF